MEPPSSTALKANPFFRPQVIPFSQALCALSLMIPLIAEIIRKVGSAPPLFRPTVSPDHGPSECIQLMEQCWEEAPEDRPSLDHIYTQVGGP